MDINALANYSGQAGLLVIYQLIESHVCQGIHIALCALKRHAYTALLFTWTDYKTIFLPITAFACATAPVGSVAKLLEGWIWIWIHLLLCNVSNQAVSLEEDAINRPWRPLPSGRVTIYQAVCMRYLTVAICILWSASYGPRLLVPTTGLILTTILYDEAGLAGHVVGKNLCNIGGYTSFEIGATSIISRQYKLDSVAVDAVILSGLVIFTTIQAQDFPDVEGDAAIGRITFPIYVPELSRIFTLGVMISWSIILGWFWQVGNLMKMILIIYGSHVGFRYYLWRSSADDKRSYLLYNLWLILIHILPLHARTGILAF